MTQVLVVGSVALDTIETPHGRQDDILGGSATHFSLSASRFSPVRLVGVVGEDFPKAHLDLLGAHRIDTSGLTRAEGKTFRWHGRFVGDMARAETVSVQLNVLGSFRPAVPEAFVDTPFVLLGNASPQTQMMVLQQLRKPSFVMLDTMNLWIDTERAGLLELLPKVDALCVNHEEAQQLAGSKTVAQAIRTLLDKGARTLIIKRGEHGATLATREFQFSIPAFPTERVVDPTGAGDSFAGGVIGYLSQGDLGARPLRRALIYGSVMGSFTVEAFGTGRIQKVTREEVEERARALMQMIAV